MPTKKRKPAKRRPKQIKHIVVVSDLHAGSSVALCPPAIELDDGGVYQYSSYQSELYGWWAEFWESWVPRATSGEPYAVVINGDIIDGAHHNTSTLVSSNIADQARLAKTLLRPVREKTSRLFIVRGTEAHAGESGREEERIAEELDCVGPRDAVTASHWELQLLLNEHLIDFSHHIGVTGSSAFESSALCRELTNLFTESGQWNKPPPYMAVRSHRHRYCQVTLPADFGETTCIVTPAWQLHTPFCRRLSNPRVPQIGGICISPHGDELIAQKFYHTPKRLPPISVDGKEAKWLNERYNIQPQML